MDPTKAFTYSGDNSVFVCKSEQNATWFFNEGSLPKNSIESRDIGGNYNILRIFQVQKENAGTYTCHVEEIENLIYEDEGVLVVKSKNF